MDIKKLSDNFADYSRCLMIMTTISDFSVSHPDVRVISKLLDKYGVARIENYLTVSEVTDLLNETRYAVSELANYKNPYGECTRFSFQEITAELSKSRDLLTGEHLSILPKDFIQTRNVIGRMFFKKLSKAYIGANAGFMEVIVFTRDYIPDKKAVYGLLHFDRRHQLKFIFYLNDVDGNNGAFGCIPGSHKFGEDLYYKAWADVLKMNPFQKSAIDKEALNISEDESRYKRIPCILERKNLDENGDFNSKRIFVEGGAGSLVIFDTHLFHFGGKVNPGKERWTLKGHTFAYVNKS